MSKKWFDFLSSFGLMMLGVCLLFLFTLSFVESPKESRYQFPKSNPRVALQGGDLSSDGFPQSEPIVPLARDNSPFSTTMTAYTAYVVDEKSGTELYDYNADEIRPLASITKIMSAIVLMGLPINWTATATVGESDCDSTSHQLMAGEIYSLDELFAVALVGSSNSAMKILARESGLSADEFVARMNKKAGELHLPTLRFTEPTGLDSDNIGSAREVAKLLAETLRYSKIVETLKIGEYYLQPENKDKPRRLWNTNWLLTKWIPSDFDRNDICGKTGYINDSLYNFAVRLADEGKHPIITVVLGAATNEARFSEARDLSDWVYGHYLWPDEDGYAELADDFPASDNVL